MIPVFRYRSPEGEAFLRERTQRSQLEQGEVQARVDEILAQVRARGDEALLAYTRQFDGADLNPETLRVTPAEREAAFAHIDPALRRTMEQSAARIRDFHQKHLAQSWEEEENGALLGQLVRPMERVGVYVPGGKAAYPSSVLMNVIPAKVAGVPEIYMATPAGADGSVPATTLVAATIAGVDTIFKMGGAQAIGALAFGTESVPKVDKITGPGNIYVALAKRAVFGHVSIDSVAGPSEILVVADESADPVYVAADLLSQAEHDELASALLVTTSEGLARAVQEELERQTAQLPRRAIVEKSLQSFGAALLVDSRAEAAECANRVAPEHLELMVSDPKALLPAIRNAGAIFLGAYSPEPLGDYMAGPNHVLPTSGTARFFSPLNVEDFRKKTSLVGFNREALLALADGIITFAEAEGLSAHANAVRVRKK